MIYQSSKNLYQPVSRTTCPALGRIREHPARSSIYPEAHLSLPGLFQLSNRWKIDGADLAVSMHVPNTSWPSRSLCWPAKPGQKPPPAGWVGKRKRSLIVRHVLASDTGSAMRSQCTCTRSAQRGRQFPPSGSVCVDVLCR